jgi:hypothetical protein
MPSRDDLSPERLDALIDGRAPGGDEEEALAALVSELRATDGAPSDLRARVRSIVRPQEVSGVRRLLADLRGTSWTRRAMALAPACVLVVGAVFAVTSIARDGGSDLRSGAAPAATGGQAATRDRESPGTPQTAVPVPPPPEAMLDQGAVAQGALTIRVADRAAVSAAGLRAREIAAEMGGRAVRESYRQRAQGPSTATVTLQVPPERYAGTRAALAAIGTVVDESADFADPTPSDTSRTERLEAPVTPGPATIRVTFVTP